MRSAFAVLFLGQTAFASESTCQDGTCQQDEATLLQLQGVRRHEAKGTVSSVPGQAQYVGCFVDDSSRDFGPWLGNNANADTNTFEGCRQACDKRFMALQYGGECFCADSYGNGDVYVQADDADCGATCTGASASFNCGGSWRQAVYDLGYSQHKAVAENTKCPHNHDDRLFREPGSTSGPITANGCRVMCENTPGCNHYSHGAWQGAYVCMGCTTAANAQTHDGFTLYDLKSYHYGEHQTNSCPRESVSEDECLAAVQQLLPPGQAQGRTSLVAGSWGWVPPGCSVQSDFTHGQDGDWAAHYNRNSAGQNDGGYTPVCTGGAVFHYGVHQTNSCPEADVSEADCLAAVQQLLPAGQEQGRTSLVAGSWGWVPPGCSVQSDFTHNQDGDWAAHYNRGNGQNDGGYTPVCAMDAANLWAQHEVDRSKCNRNENLVFVRSREECQAVAEENGDDWYSFRHNVANNGQHKCFSSSHCDDALIGDRTNEWNIYRRAAPALQNGGFEEGFTSQETGNSHTMSSSGYEYTNIFPGWQAAGGTVMVASGNGPWGGIVASSGDHLLALQSSSAAITQTVFNFHVGREYTLTVHAAQRTNSPGGTNALLKVSANGQELLNKHVTATAMEAQVVTFTADSGIVQLKIENDVASGDQTVFVDGITLS